MSDEGAISRIEAALYAQAANHRPDDEVLAEELKKLGLPAVAGLEGLLRHVYASRDMVVGINKFMAEQARKGQPLSPQVSREAVAVRDSVRRSVLMGIRAEGDDDVRAPARYAPPSHWEAAIQRVRLLEELHLPLVGPEPEMRDD